jgi:hypothetical protein
VWLQKPKAASNVNDGNSSHHCACVALARLGSRPVDSSRVLRTLHVQLWICLAVLPQLVATACLYLASKVQESPKYLRDVIRHAEQKKYHKWDSEHPAERGQWDNQVSIRAGAASACQAQAAARRALLVVQVSSTSLAASSSNDGSNSCNTARTVRSHCLLLQLQFRAPAACFLQTPACHSAIGCHLPLVLAHHIMRMSLPACCMPARLFCPAVAPRGDA